MTRLARVPGNKDWLYSAQLCEWLGVSRTTLHRLMRRDADPIPYRLHLGTRPLFYKPEVTEWQLRQPHANESTHPEPRLLRAKALSNVS